MGHLSSYERNRSGRTLRPSDLCIDDYVERIVTETRDQALEEIKITADGSWLTPPVAKLEKKLGDDEDETVNRKEGHHEATVNAKEDDQRRSDQKDNSQVKERDN